MVSVGGQTLSILQCQFMSNIVMLILCLSCLSDGYFRMYLRNIIMVLSVSTAHSVNDVSVAGKESERYQVNL